MAGSVVIHRPERWDNPLDPGMTDHDVDRILAREPFRRMVPEAFSASASLRDLVRNDMRITRYEDGDIVVRAGDYGTSAYLVISGTLHVALQPGLPDALLGRTAPAKKGVFEALGQLWTAPRLPEVRDPSRYRDARGTGTRRIAEDETRIFLQDVPAIIDKYGTARLGPGDMFGEIAALARNARVSTVFSEGGAEVLEIRRGGIREIRRRVDDFRAYVDRLYRERSLRAHIRETPMFRHLDEEAISKITEKTLFETYGDFDWHRSYNRFVGRTSAERLAGEPVIAREGDYPDGLLMVRSGFVRVSRRVNHGDQTVRYIGRGATYGFEEIAHNWHTDHTVGLQHTVRSVGYTDVLRVPTSIIEEFVLPTIAPALMPPAIERRRDGRSVAVERRAYPLPAEPKAAKPGVGVDVLEFLVENRYINGVASMLIDLDRCVRCDACAEACAVGHNNNPRFNRHGPRHRNVMVANACMHCVDPVCMNGCPTGAIHRSPFGGQVVVNDATCVGCGTCATNCPYDNIRMVEIRDDSGNLIVDHSTGSTVMKATKCDLCVDQPGGPACQRACPHDALIRMDMSDLDTLAGWLHR